MKERIREVSDRLNHIANHIVVCNHCIGCKKANFIVRALDNIRGDLERATMNKSITKLYNEPDATAS